MSHPSISNPSRSHATADAPPPYSMSSNDALVASSATSSVVSLPSTRSASPTSHAVSDSKSAHLYQPAGSSAAAEPSEEIEAPKRTKIAVPPDVQRAKAPLLVKQKNISITSNFFIFKADSSKANVPDVSLETSNSRISSSVYVDANGWGRPITIEALTKNSSIELAVHTLQAGQAVDVRAITKNSSASVLLPRDFKGLLILSTSHSRTILSSDLQKVSVRVSNQDAENSKLNESLFRAFSKSVIGGDEDERAVWYEINGGDGPSRAIIKTENSKASAGFIGEEKGSGESSCLVM